MSPAILAACAIAATAASIAVAIKLAGNKIISQLLAFPRKPTPVTPIEKGEDGLYPEPPCGPEIFYGSIDGEARARINGNRTALDRARRVWAETHRPERVSVQAEDGCTLAGFIYRAEIPTQRWAICVHGYLGSHDEMEAVAMRYCMNGYNALAVDLRHHGESEGDLVGMGWLDRRDIVSWCRSLLEREGDSIAIVLHGWSMGGATVMLAASEEDLPEQVAACVEDCGFASFKALLELATSNLPAPVAKAVTASMRPSIRKSYGIDIEDPVIEKRIATCRIPVFFLHGDHDIVVPPADLDTLYGACKAPGCKRWLLGQTGHCQAIIADTEEYFAQVFSFTDPIMAARAL